MTREEAMYLLNNLRSVAEGKEDEAIDMAIEALQNKPQGEWKPVTEMFDALDGIKTYITGMRCSKCSHMFDFRDYNFCPNCGADMRGDNNG